MKCVRQGCERPEADEGHRGSDGMMPSETDAHFGSIGFDVGFAVAGAQVERDGGGDCGSGVGGEVGIVAEVVGDGFQSRQTERHQAPGICIGMPKPREGPARTSQTTQSDDDPY